MPSSGLEAEEISYVSYRQEQGLGFLLDPHAVGMEARLIGVEIELAGGKAGAYPWIAECRRVGHGVVSDGSIRASPAARAWLPVEITTLPANGRKLDQSISRLDSALRAAKARTNTSCGTHVHVDARDLGWSDVRTLARVWRAVEPAMFSALPPSRRSNEYCLPCGDTYGAAAADGDFKTAFLKTLYRISPPKPPDSNAMGLVDKRYYKRRYDREARAFAARYRETTARKYNPARYYALNLHSWFFRGTVEFRLGSGTVHLVKTSLPWAKICRAIVHFAATANSERLSTLLDCFQERGSLPALQGLLGRLSTEGGTNNVWTLRL